MSEFEMRHKRLQDAIDLKEPDRVPLIPMAQTFPVIDSGHTMKEALYNFDVLAESLLDYAEKYQPDSMFVINAQLGGMGPIYELMKAKNLHWAGMKDSPISDNSCHQFIEYPILNDDEFPQFTTDYLSWFLEKGLPRVFGAAEPFSSMRLASAFPFYLGFQQFTAAFSTPEAREMIETFWKVTELETAISQKNLALVEKMEKEIGIPVQAQGFAYAPFDAYSDFMRGSILAMTDLYDYEEAVMQYCDKVLNDILGMVAGQGQVLKGRWVFIPLHKGMDGFLSDEQYRKYYWIGLQTVIQAIIDHDMTPYVYTEGPYNTRLEFLKEVPKGKVIYHFEDCDMAAAKKALGDVACISGNFPQKLLQFGTVEEVREAVKRLLDICAPGGGYMFDTDGAVDEVKPENFRAMMDTVREYGVY